MRRALSALSQTGSRTTSLSRAKHLQRIAAIARSAPATLSRSRFRPARGPPESACASAGLPDNGADRKRAPPAMPETTSETIPAWVDGRLVPVDKLEVHRRGLRHPAVSVFLLDGERTLIQRRALGKYHTPGLWANACCTHPRWGEEPAACALRRLREELGVARPRPALARPHRVPRRGRRRPRRARGRRALHRRRRRAGAADSRPRRGDGGALGRPRRAARRDRGGAGGLHAVAAHLSRRPRQPDLREGGMTAPEHNLARLIAGLRRASTPTRGSSSASGACPPTRAR